MAPLSFLEKTATAVAVMAGIVLLNGMVPATASCPADKTELVDGHDYLDVTLPAYSGQVNMVAGGVGLHDTGSGRITLTVPAGATVEGAYLYWQGHDGHEPPNNTGDDDLVLVVDSNPAVAVSGDLIGITIQLSYRFRFTYRADITSYVQVGTHDYNLSDFDLTELNDNGERYGAGIIIIYSHASLPYAQIQIADGVDYFLEAKGHPSSQLLQLDFTDVPVARSAHLILFVGGVAADQATGLWYQCGGDAIPQGSIIDAPDAVEWNNSSSTIAGVDTDPFYSADGAEFDRTVISISVPPHIPWLTLQIESQADSPYGKRSASGSWSMCALYLEEPTMGSIGDLLWDDVDGDGVQDPGENGIDGVTVDIANDGGTWSSSQVTGDNPATPALEHGWYDFTNLPPDDYIVDVDDSSLPPNYAGYPPILTSANDPLAVSLAEGEDFNDADFGYMENPIPVELMSFSAVWSGSAVHLSWSTASETENMGYDIYRGEGAEGPYIKINETIIPGAGSSNSVHTYSYTDRSIETDHVYYYKLADISYQGELMYHGPISVAVSATPVAYELHQNYPNPFNPETNIQFVLKEGGKVSIKLYNMTGQAVRTLIDGWMQQGNQSAVWNGRDDSGKMLPSGTYFCIMRVNDFEISRKIVFMR